MEAQVIKILGTSYTILLKGKLYSAVPRGNIKLNGKILVGDKVLVQANDYADGYVITKILPRTSCLVRPPVANLQQLVIVVSAKPNPDYELLDKLIVYCYQNNITPVILVNKCDIMSKQDILNIIDEYKYCTEHILAISALEGTGIDKLKKILRGKLSAFAGQSAVGKSTLINSLIGNNLAEVGGLSAKTERGKHTTRHTEIYLLEGDIMLADTAGFSMLALDDIEPKELKDFYPDFTNSECLYSGCTHINCTAKDCAVVADVEGGVINANRYKRYVKLYNELLEKWRRKYD